jgi:16S rRNA (guanine527-N7)-methyltransferase
MNKEIFIEELKKININISKEQLIKLEQYYQILIEENKKYNLTSITDKEQVYLKHFYDSLTITKIIDLSNQALCDIGTGAGFPGLVLKILFPNLKITLVEATGKKCHFLNLVISKLKLKDIEVINERAEIYSKSVREKYDIVTSRAVAPLKHLLEYSIPLVKVNGYYIAMKSDISNEIDNINNYESKLNIKEINKISFQLPKENSLRTLIKYEKLSKTNQKYPRKYTEIKKKSL